MTTTQSDVLNAQIAVLQGQLTQADLQNTARKAQINLQITKLQDQLAALNPPS